MRAPFWKKWIPEVLGDAALQSSAVIERAHRIGPARDAKMPPRTLIVKFLIYKGKQQTAVVAAARPKKRHSVQGPANTVLPGLGYGNAPTEEKKGPAKSRDPTWSDSSCEDAGHT